VIHHCQLLGNWQNSRSLGRAEHNTTDLESVIELQIQSCSKRQYNCRLARGVHIAVHFTNHIAVVVVVILIQAMFAIAQAIVVEVAEAVLALYGVIEGDEAVGWLHGANVVVLVVFWLARIINPRQLGIKIRVNSSKPDERFVAAQLNASLTIKKTSTSTGLGGVNQV
jgi:hypothetical protein